MTGEVYPESLEFVVNQTKTHIRWLGIECRMAIETPNGSTYITAFSMDRMDNPLNPYVGAVLPSIVRVCYDNEPDSVQDYVMYAKDIEKPPAITLYERPKVIEDIYSYYRGEFPVETAFITSQGVEQVEKIKFLIEAGPNSVIHHDTDAGEYVYHRLENVSLDQAGTAPWYRVLAEESL